VGVVELQSGSGRTYGDGATMIRVSGVDAIGTELVAALADRSAKRLEECFRSEARLRALVPSGFREREGSSAVAATFMAWFAEAESIQVLDQGADRIGGRLRLRYRFRERYADGAVKVIEQQAFCDVKDGRIVSIDLLCSGHVPEPSDATGHVRQFDAGDLGCGSGLPQEFRRQINALPMGGILEVVARDPSAREDLPSLARLLGQRVLSVKGTPDGSTVLTVQRNR
jgi:tRNA 2-thiouridine synthesizing protein A